MRSKPLLEVVNQVLHGKKPFSMCAISCCSLQSGENRPDILFFTVGRYAGFSVYHVLNKVSYWHIFTIKYGDIHYALLNGKTTSIDVTIASFKVREMSPVKSVASILSVRMLSLGMLMVFFF